MEFFFSNQTTVFLYSLLVGVLVGIMYDVLLIKRRVFGSSAVMLFVEDVLFCLVSFLILVVFVLKANYGEMRWHELFFPFLSFYVYRKSIGVLTVKCGSAVVGFIVGLLKTIVGFAVIRPSLFAAKLIKRLAIRILNLFSSISAKRDSASRKKKTIKAAKSGFRI